MSCAPPPPAPPFLGTDSALGGWEGPVLGAAYRAIGAERDRLLAFECHRHARQAFDEAVAQAAGGGGRGSETCVVAVVGAAHAAGMAREWERLVREYSAEEYSAPYLETLEALYDAETPRAQVQSESCGR